MQPQATPEAVYAALLAVAAGLVSAIEQTYETPSRADLAAMRALQAELERLAWGLLAHDG